MIWSNDDSSRSGCNHNNYYSAEVLNQRSLGMDFFNMTAKHGGRKRDELFEEGAPPLRCDCVINITSAKSFC
eukprot:scaffold5581_cov156-Skeletonema_marinoi.AAC.7